LGGCDPSAAGGTLVAVQGLPQRRGSVAGLRWGELRV
jgi:hypothetical protein